VKLQIAKSTPSNEVPDISPKTRYEILSFMRVQK